MKVLEIPASPAISQKGEGVWQEVRTLDRRLIAGVTARDTFSVLPKDLRRFQGSWREETMTCTCAQSRSPWRRGLAVAVATKKG